jgi:hypothetical protein
MSARFRLFGRLRKVEEDDDGTLHVTGIASTETPDSAGEIVTADAIRKALPDFMSLGTGALREMHGLSAAGKVDRAEIDDANRTVIEGTVVDPVAIKKVQTGVYKGFSIGGRVLARDSKNSKIITKIALNEISLVDRPANSEAVLTLWKADGLTECRTVDRRAAMLQKLATIEATADELFEKLDDLKRRLTNAEEFNRIWEASAARTASIRGLPETKWRN